MESDWQSAILVGDRLKYMLDNEVMCDVTFVVGPEGKTQRINAHKYILASSSAVFFNMLAGPLAEKGDIAIPDIDPCVFKIMLDSIYTDQKKVDKNNVDGLVYAAEKYMSQKLKKDCTSYLYSTITNDNAFSLLQKSHDFNLKDLKIGCLGYIVENAITCMRSKTFLDLSKECLQDILKLDALPLSEEYIFESSVLWAKEECKRQEIEESGENLRHILGNNLYDIRFPVMDPGYFATEVLPSEILNESEISSVYRSIFRKEKEKFQSCHRGVVDFMMCNPDLELVGCSRNDKTYKVDFKSSINCSIVGVILFTKGLQECEASLTIHSYDIHIGKAGILDHMKTKISSSDLTKSLHKINFSSAANISREKSYCIELQIPAQSCYGAQKHDTSLQVKEWNVVILDYPPFTCCNHNCRIARSPRYGMIAGIILSRATTTTKCMPYE